jgi:hypothetical protein
MPAAPRHDEGLALGDHGVLGRVVEVDGGDQSPFKHTEYLVAGGVAFPIIGVDGMVI